MVAKSRHSDGSLRNSDGSLRSRFPSSISVHLFHRGVSDPPHWILVHFWVADFLLRFQFTNTRLVVYGAKGGPYGPKRQGWPVRIIWVCDFLLRF